MLTSISFPSSRTSLWDSSPQSATSHISTSNHPPIIVIPKIVSLFANINQTHSLSFLSKALHTFHKADSDEESRKCLKLVLQSIHASDRHFNEDEVPIDVTILNVSKNNDTQSTLSEDYLNWIKSIDHIGGNWKGPLKPYYYFHPHITLTTNDDEDNNDNSDLRFDSIRIEILLPHASMNLFQIRPLRLLSTPLTQSLSQGNNKTHTPLYPFGYLTLDQTRKLLPLIDSDHRCYSVPLVGVWVSGVSSLDDFGVWFACFRYLSNPRITDRATNTVPEVLSSSQKKLYGDNPNKSSTSFIVLIYFSDSQSPHFFQCTPQNTDNLLNNFVYLSFETSLSQQTQQHSVVCKFQASTIPNDLIKVAESCNIKIVSLPHNNPKVDQQQQQQEQVEKIAPSQLSNEHVEDQHFMKYLDPQEIENHTPLPISSLVHPFEKKVFAKRSSTPIKEAHDINPPNINSNFESTESIKSKSSQSAGKNSLLNTSHSEIAGNKNETTTINEDFMHNSSYQFSSPINPPNNYHQIHYSPPHMPPPPNYFHPPPTYNYPPPYYYYPTTMHNAPHLTPINPYMQYYSPPSIPQGTLEESREMILLQLQSMRLQIQILEQKLLQYPPSPLTQSSNNTTEQQQQTKNSHTNASPPTIKSPKTSAKPTTPHTHTKREQTQKREDNWAVDLQEEEEEEEDDVSQYIPNSLVDRSIASTDLNPRRPPILPQHTQSATVGGSIIDEEVEYYSEISSIRGGLPSVVEYENAAEKTQTVTNNKNTWFDNKNEDNNNDSDVSLVISPLSSVTVTPANSPMKASQNKKYSPQLLQTHTTTQTTSSSPFNTNTTPKKSHTPPNLTLTHHQNPPHSLSHFKKQSTQFTQSTPPHNITNDDVSTISTIDDSHIVYNPNEEDYTDDSELRDIEKRYIKHDSWDSFSTQTPPPHYLNNRSKSKNNIYYDESTTNSSYFDASTFSSPSTPLTNRTKGNSAVTRTYHQKYSP